MALSEFKFGWTGLQDSLNTIVKALNTSIPIGGAGVRVTDTAAGKLIEVTKEQSTSGDQMDGYWQWVVFVHPTTCEQVRAHVWVKKSDQQAMASFNSSAV